MSILLDKYKLHLLDKIYDEINNSSTDSYYLGIGRTDEWDDEDNPPAETDELESVFEVERDLILGIKIKSTDIAYIIRKNSWTSGTVYSQWNITDKDLYDKKYFIINSNNDVYKCISNNLEAQSTVEPTSTITDTFKLADGYIWKYMFSIPADDLTKFGTTDFIPIVSNTTVESAAVSGAIEYIEVQNGGNNWVSYNTGSIKGVVSNTVYKIDDSANSTVDFYSNSSIYISSGTGSGSLVEISSSSSNGSGKYIVLTSNTTLDATSEYIISPTLTIDGDGTGAKAYLEVANNIITSANIIDNGQDYTKADLTVKGSTGYGTGASLQALIGPKNGHGFNPKDELNAQNISINIKVANNVSTDLPTGIKYRQLNLMYNPKFSNNDVSTDNVISYATTFEVTNNEVFSVGTDITGLTSGAKGTIYYKNGSTYKINYCSGTLANGETITTPSGNTAEVANTSSISNMKKNGMDILYYINNVPITKASDKNEIIKFTQGLG